MYSTELYSTEPYSTEMYSTSVPAVYWTVHCTVYSVQYWTIEHRVVGKNLLLPQEVKLIGKIKNFEISLG